MNCESWQKRGNYYSKRKVIDSRIISIGKYLQFFFKLHDVTNFEIYLSQKKGGTYFSLVLFTF